VIVCFRFPTLGECAYGGLVILAAITLLLLIRLNQPVVLSQEARVQIFNNHVEAAATAAEERALQWPAHLFGTRVTAQVPQDIAFAIFLDPANCSNGIASDIKQLNAFHRASEGTVKGYYVAHEQDLFEEFMSLHGIQLPVDRENPMFEHPDTMTTPLVVVLDISSGTVLDAHQPIPNDVQKSNLFYDKWVRLMTRYEKS